MLDAIRLIFKPLMRQGQATPVSISLQESPEIDTQGAGYFVLTAGRTPLAWLAIDRCTLDQLASSYYGGVNARLMTPLRSVSQSELRLANRIITSALETLPKTNLNFDLTEIENLPNLSSVVSPLQWRFEWPRTHPFEPISLFLSDALLGSLAEQPSQYQPDPNLKHKMQQRLTQIPVKAKVELARQSVPVNVLDALRPGEILPVNMHARCPVTIGGRTQFYASVHGHDGKLVAKLNHDTHKPEE
ncbi:FliM/FliN family flagellar motor switch protein [Ferrimonas aestuarii]|nr:FliM/FliN family flagellar motor switch protein [Ferrimonas aestuarii]